MGKLVVSNRLQPSYELAWFSLLMRELEQQINGVSEGRIAASYSAHTAAPTGTGQMYAQGDFIRNSQPSELGTAGSKYVILGFACVAAGSPGTWVQCRFLTGS